MWHCLCETIAEGVFGVSEVKTADVSHCILGEILVLRLMILTTLRCVVGESNVARGRRLCDVTAFTVIHRILRLFTTASGKSKEMLWCAIVSGRYSC